MLVYRLLSFWAILPVGWGAWGILAVTARRSDRRTATAGPRPGPFSAAPTLRGPERAAP
ncbi:MAG: hypothetical protein ACRDZY_14230 [Acidimicrobiales bacterium]